MLQFHVIGNLGSDARVEESNGRKFVSFNVAHTDRFTDADGKEHEQTQWISCALNGDGGQLLQYLKKGKAVYVSGRGSARIYSSPKLKMMVAGLNLSVDRLELLGGASDDVPRHLIVPETGAMIETYKAYFVSPDNAKAAGAKKGHDVVLYSESNRQFTCDANGWVKPVESGPVTDEQNANAE